jgi:hypothetical protein
VVAALSLATGVAFSLRYWGYPWSVPELDGRTRDVRWTAVSGFKSSMSGREWTRDDERDLRWDINRVPDGECCDVERIVKLTGSELPAVTREDLTTLEAEALSLIEIEAGAPGYDGAKRLYGVAALGMHPTGEPIAFASFVGGEVSNDHHAMYDVLWARSPPRLLSSTKYYGDVAGIEGFEAPQVAILLFVPFLAIGLLVVTIWRAREAALSRRTG